MPKALAGGWPVTRLGEPEPEPKFFRATIYRISPSATRQRHRVLQVVLTDDTHLLQAIRRLSLPLLPHPISSLLRRLNSSLGPHVVSVLERTRSIPSLRILPIYNCEFMFQLRYYCCINLHRWMGIRFCSQNADAQIVRSCSNITQPLLYT